MEKQKITWMGDRQPVQTKYGEKKKVSIKTDRHPDKFISVWINGTSDSWKVGSEVEFTLKSREYNGKTYYDAELPKQVQNTGQLTDLIRMVGQLDTRMGKIEHYLQQLLPIPKGTKVGNTDIEYPTDELDPTF